ncbi:MAG: MurR/RpiR family transcriptional regulator [Erysipelotrichaceae bacterium]|nr:MurR/RpiR family transcriptional regulator [Erysipelotrichaceae bacterium]
MITKEQFDSLNKKEKLVLQFVQVNKGKAGYMNIRQLAKACEVSSATIMRFIQKLNFTSYKEFQLWCIEKDKEEFDYQSNEIIESIIQMERPYFQDKLDEVAEMLIDHDVILFQGIGNSSGIASYGARCFSNKGKLSMYINDPFYNYESLPKNMIAIFMSVSGDTKEMIVQAENFVKNRIPIITITANNESVLAQMADYTLSYNIKVQKNRQLFDMTSQMPAVFIIEKLAHLLSEKMSHSVTF